MIDAPIISVLHGCKGLRPLSLRLLKPCRSSDKWSRVQPYDPG